MTRTVGARNVVAFEKRAEIETTSSNDIKHLAEISDKPPIEQLKGIIGHQENYLKWLSSRHNSLASTKAELASLKGETSRKPKDATHKKYRWYAGQLALLEAINAFEVFYKRTFINLAKAIRDYVPAEKIKGSVDGKILWSLRGKSSAASLLFEHQLFHDLENIDKCSSMLVDARRYNINSPKPDMAQRVKSLQAVFQIRHTLSHNHGHVTTSDAAKFKMLGYSIKSNEIIDPVSNSLGQAVPRLIETEAEEFTNWLLESVAIYLEKATKERGIVLLSTTRDTIVSSLGTSPKLTSLAWS